MRRRWFVVAAGAALALAGRPAEAAGTLDFRCTNLSSGASWRVSVDVAHGRVNDLPAEIGEKSIRWRDPAWGSYDLDRATGALDMRNASSTGGYFIHFACKPE